MRVRIGGKLVFRCLGTETYTTAKLRLPLVLKEVQDEKRKPHIEGSEIKTFGDALAEYEIRLDQDIRLKPSSKRYRRHTIRFIEKTWPDIRECLLNRIGVEEMRQWAVRLHKAYSATGVNNTIGTMRAILDIPLKRGLLSQNPAANLSKVRVRQKELNLPSSEQFRSFVTSIRQAGARQSQDCGDMVEFLAYTGLRLSEAAQVRWEDVDLQKNTIRVRGDEESATKNHERRTIPVIENCKSLFEQIKERRGKEPSEAAVLNVRECQKSMNHAAAKIGMSRITHHDLRHLFATRCIESGVDIPTVSRWLGHKDGGALAMKVYGHLRDEHSQIAAQKVTF